MQIPGSKQTVMFCLLGVMLSITSVANAKKQVADNLTPNDSWFVAVGGGGTTLSMPSTVSVANGANVSSAYDYDVYSVQNPRTSLFQFLVGYGWHVERSFMPFFSTYFQYRHYMHANINGTVDQYNIPEFLNYNYEINYSADLFMLGGKFNLFRVQRVLPYVSVGLGAMLSHLSGYDETALANVTPRTSPAYGGNVTRKAAIALGLGFDVILNQSTWLTFGYEWLTQGNMVTGSGTGDDWQNTVLNFHNVKMNTLFVNISANLPQGLGGQG